MRPGYRTRVLVVATTLLDAEAFPWREAAALYGARWQAELDLRSLKDTLPGGERGVEALPSGSRLNDRRMRGTPMIWFTCKKCGKKHGRADNLSGTLVFCDCGQGNPVPWQSNTTAPETPPEPPRRPAPPPRPPPRRAPDDDDDWDNRRRPPGPMPLPLDDASAGDLLRRRRAQVFHRRRSGFCFNHDDIATDQTCAECKEYFCPNCVVELQGKTLGFVRSLVPTRP